MIAQALALLMLGGVFASDLPPPQTYSAPPSYGGGPLGGGPHVGGPIGGGYGPHGGPYEGPHDSVVYSSHELAEAEDYAHRVANEKAFLRKRVDAVKEQERDLLDALNNAINLAQSDIYPKQDEQNDRLDFIKDQIKELLHDLGDKEADLAGEVSIAKAELARVFDIWARIEDLDETNANQDALLAKIDVALRESKEAIEEKLQVREETSEGNVETLKASLNASGDWINDRHCAVNYVVVELDRQTGVGSKFVPIPTKIFKNQVPTVMCALQGFKSYLNLDRTINVPAYGKYDENEFQNLALAVDCKSNKEKVEVVVTDQCRGDGNAVAAVTVHVRVCSFAAQAGYAYSVGYSYKDGYGYGDGYANKDGHAKKDEHP